jgi:hypothetical protein
VPAAAAGTGGLALTVTSPITSPLIALHGGGSTNPNPDEARSLTFTPRRPLSRNTSKEVLSTSPLRLHSTDSGGGVRGSPSAEKFTRGGATAHVLSTTTMTTGPQTLISPLRMKRAARPLSREASKEALQTLSSYTDPLSASTTTTSIIQHHSPHPPNSNVPSPAGATMISTTTSYTHLPASAVAVSSSSDDKLPAVTTNGSNSNSTAASLTATLLAAANASKDSSHVSLPALVSAHAGRIAHLETITHTQAESIIELQQIVRNLQKQLVMVMQFVPSTSGTGGVASIHLASPPSYPRVSSDSTGQQPHRSRSNTELRERERERMGTVGNMASGGSTGGSNTPRTPRTFTTSGGAQAQAEMIVSQLHFGAHTDSTESLPGPGGESRQTARSTKDSKTNSRYSSPRNATGGSGPHSSKAHSTKVLKSSAAQSTTTSSHHFNFHPSISTHPPPGQIAIEPVYPGASSKNSSSGVASSGTSAKRIRLQGHTIEEQMNQGRNPARRLSPGESEQFARNPSRRLSPVEAFLAREEFHNNPPPAHGQHASLGQYPPMPTQSPYQYHHPQQNATSPGDNSASSPYLNAHSGHDRTHSVESNGAGASAIGSLDPLRPLPMQHIVTQGKSGMTEYVLSFRDGEEPVATPGGGIPEYHLSAHPADSAHGPSHPTAYEAPRHDMAELSPRSAAVEQWRLMHGSTATATAGGKKEKGDKKDKKKKKEKDHTCSTPYTPSLAVSSPDSQYPDGPSSPRRYPTQHTHVSSGVDAAAAKDAERAREAERKLQRRAKEKKVCKVAGCEEPRKGAEKYCKAHAGPAPLNPNARKMMFQH